ncbi:YbaB/EbfC family nucleoid-associated protein [Nocardia sp. NPDC051911]|uniref:YbaB/EbfC family nucleoid-associated protein n=1 Tax=Nocardia sp. NPDC051911 TaxID=3154648 RepID=UPI00342825CA
MAGIEQDPLDAHSSGLGQQVGSMLEQLQRQREGFVAAQSRLSSATAEAWSSDRLVRVVSNIAGIPIEVHVVPEAFKRSTPEKLGRSVTEAAQLAARLVAERAQQALGPIEQLVDGMPDLPDLIPGAPSVKDLFKSVVPRPPSPTPSKPKRPRVDDDDEDEYFRNASYLEERP